MKIVADGNREMVVVCATRQDVVDTACCIQVRALRWIRADDDLVKICTQSRQKGGLDKVCFLSWAHNGTNNSHGR